MAKRFCEFLLFGFGLKIIELIGGLMIESTYSFISNTVYILSALSLAGYMVYRYLAKPNMTFAFPITGKLLSFIRVNNPDLFPGLNEANLKTQISSIAHGLTRDYTRIINSVALYPGFDRKYVMVVEIPKKIRTEDIDLYQEFINHWADSGLHENVGEDFRWDVYKSRSDAEADPFLDNWFVWTQEEGDEIPGDLISGGEAWRLFH